VSTLALSCKMSVEYYRQTDILLITTDIMCKQTDLIGKPTDIFRKSTDKMQIPTDISDRPVFSQYLIVSRR
jgi:hypothetical protein